MRPMSEVCNARGWESHENPAFDLPWFCSLSKNQPHDKHEAWGSSPDQTEPFYVWPNE